jgi:hypothetical protein
VCHLAHDFQVLAALGGVGTADDRLDVLDLDLGGAVAGELLVGLSWEDSSHQAVDVLDSQSLASVVLLERVNLDVVDGTGLDLVAVALLRGRKMMRKISRENSCRLLPHSVRGGTRKSCQIRGFGTEEEKMFQ